MSPGPGAGCWVLGAGCWVLGAGCWVLGAGCRVSDVASQVFWKKTKSKAILEAKEEKEREREYM